MSDRLILGTRKGLFILEPSNGSWNVARTAFVGAPVSYADVDPRNGTIWACLDYGHWGTKLHRSTDGGENWEELEPPRYPEGSELSEGTPATVLYLWSMAAGGADQPKRMYIGTEPGGLFQTDDGGTTFSLVEGLWNHPSRPKWMGGGRDNAGIHSIMVDPRDSSRMLVAVSCAGVFETTDGGASWNARNRGMSSEFLPDPNAEVGHDPHLVVASPGNPDVLWQQNHVGIFRSADGAGSWTKISEEGGPAHFGFAIAADDDPNVAWVVPAKADMARVAVDGAICVSRTDDGGKSWTTFRNGLPQQNSYDIVFRHALDAKDGNVAFGSTTGNVFASADRGESWQCVSNYLPPVYSVRFARD